MCLQKITKRYEPPDPRVRQAYKIMEKNGYTPFYQVQYTEAWLQATEHSIQIDSPEGEFTTFLVSMCSRRGKLRDKP